MTDKEIIDRARLAEKRTTGFCDLVHSLISKGVNSAYGIGFIEGMVEYRNSIQKEQWKPTETMLEALRWAKCEFHPDCPETMEQLQYLYNELKQIYYDRT